jgi:ADP-dependent NAD(P)H-hydrate dehydratase / NAD(P)H-hydrate epimerase
LDITDAVAAALLPNRPIDGHKGTFGHVLILAGSEGFTGAAKLAALGALRSGAGLVSVGVPRAVYAPVASGLLEAMAHPMPSTPEGTLAYAALKPALDFAARVDAVVLGPGLSMHPDTQRFVREFVPACPKPLLLDADGLNAMAGKTELFAAAIAPIVITPHPGEMGRLSGKSSADVLADREAVAKRAAHDWRVTVVLKGHRTLVAAPGREPAENTTGNSGMATGGTGDVLSGLIGGLLAQGMEPVEAAMLGAYVHGRAGDLAAASVGERALIASDLADRLGAAWMELEAKRA